MKVKLCLFNFRDTFGTIPDYVTLLLLLCLRQFIESVYKYTVLEIRPL